MSTQSREPQPLGMASRPPFADPASVAWRSKSSAAGLLLMGLIAIGCMALQAWFLGAHWIDPDEGAHLMDARLVLSGLVPGVNFDARQPLYVYSYVPAFKLFGASLLTGRLMILLETWVTALLIFQIGRRLWNLSCGVMASVLFLCAPTILFYTPIVQEQPLAMLLTASGILGLIAFARDGRSRWLALSGVAFGVGYYVRQSALAGVFAAVVTLLIVTPSYRMLWRRFACFFGGMAFVTLGMLAWYSQYMPVSAMLQNDGLFPPDAIYTAAHGFVSRLAAAKGPDVAQLADTVRGSRQTWDTTVRNLRIALTMNVPFLFGAVLALVWAARAGLRAWRRRESRDPDLVGVSIILAWLVGMAALYGYWTTYRGFFQDYISEMAPPMALLLAWVLHRTLRLAALAPYVLLSVALAIVSCGLIFVAVKMVVTSGAVVAVVCLAWFGWKLRKALPASTRRNGAIFLGGLVALALTVGGMRFWLFPKTGHGSSAALIGAATLSVVLLIYVCARPGACSGFGPSVLLLALAASAMLAVGSNARTLGPSFSCVWPPRSLPEVTNLILKNSTSNDTVMSGGVIWELEAGRQPFAAISHPTEFRDREHIPAAEIERVRRLFATQPPKIIILDGYTKQTFFRILPSLPSQIEREYSKVGTVEAGKTPVQVFVRSASARAGASDLKKIRHVN